MATPDRCRCFVFWYPKLASATIHEREEWECKKMAQQEALNKRKAQKEAKKKAEEAAAAAIKKGKEEAAAAKKKAEEEATAAIRKVLRAKKKLQEQKREAIEAERKAKEVAAATKKAEEEAVEKEKKQKGARQQVVSLVKNSKKLTKNKFFELLFYAGAFPELGQNLMALLHPDKANALQKYYHLRCNALAMDISSFYQTLEGEPLAPHFKEGMVSITTDACSVYARMIYGEGEVEWDFHQNYVHIDTLSGSIYVLDPIMGFGGLLLEEYIPFFMAKVTLPATSTSLVFRFCWRKGKKMEDEFGIKYVVPRRIRDNPQGPRWVFT